jgi:hypothetical protein
LEPQGARMRGEGQCERAAHELVEGGRRSGSHWPGNTPCGTVHGVVGERGKRCETVRFETSLVATHVEAAELTGCV